MVFFFNDTATTEIYTLSLHDALPIFHAAIGAQVVQERVARGTAHHLDEAGPRPLTARHHRLRQDRKSTRLNSSHANISYAVFCLKKKNTPFFPHSPFLTSHSYDFYTS